MTMFYSKSKNTWLPAELKGVYEASGSWPDDAREYPVELFHETVSNRPLDKLLAPDAKGRPTLVDKPAPTVEQLIEAMRVKIQAHMDGMAKSYGYDDIKAAVTYADEPAVPKFQSEGRAFRAWRSLVWDYAYKALADVQAGERPQPTPSELISELPEFKGV